NLWFNLFDLYEIGLLPIIKNFSLRSLAVRLRRWREPVEVANILLRRIVFRRRFSVSRIYPVEEMSAHKNDPLQGRPGLGRRRCFYAASRPG
ncbi:MAG: hypothetical protein WA324_14225, partial [Bryobacteraceae bacterium]